MSDRPGKPLTIFVLSNPAAPYLRTLAELPEDTHLVVGNTVEAFQNAAGQADVIFNGGSRDLLQAVWNIAPNVRWVHHIWAGVEKIMFPELRDSPVPLTNARGVFAESLGEFAVAAMLFFAKDLRRMIRNQEAGRWEEFDVHELYRQSVGIVGYGHIGKATARRAHALGMKVAALRRRTHLPSEDRIVDEVLPPERLRDLMATSDYVVVSTPLTPETRGMIGVEELAVMKPGAVIVNVGRGPVIDEPALVRALEERRIRAALDVYNEEPLPAGHPFYRLDNVLLSPHCADHTADWLEQAMRLFVRNVEHFRNGEPLENVVDKHAGY
jgi:phosphoglycerate dehydrogenase-like enzyme